MDSQQLTGIVSALGGLGNITSVTNCMTRLRVTVIDEEPVDEAAIRQDPAVLGLVHDRLDYYEIVVGPGKAKTFANALRDMLKDATGHDGLTVPFMSAMQPPNASHDDAASAGSKDKQSPLGARFKRFCKILGGIFVPLIPGFIVSGICGSFAMIIQQLVPDYSNNIAWGCLYNVLFLIQQSLLAYLTAWTGYRAAEQFGGTPILGGMLGMITSMSNINDIATFLGLYNADTPLSSILMAGKGGVLAVVIGVFLLVKVEHLVDRHMPDVLKVVGTPLITILVCTAFYVFAIMPAAGFLASWLCDGMEAVCMNENPVVRIIAGYVGAALFLPLVALGMHHGLVALYAIQLQAVGYVTLYPALCMAGAGQVGAALAIRRKARKCGNTKVMAIADAGIPAGFLGVGEPLVYGLTLPMGKPFITAGIGAGFGGAFVMFMQVAATAWGPSGLLGLCVMDAGPNGIAASLGSYAVGLLISYVMGFIITNALVKEREVAELYCDEGQVVQPVAAKASARDASAPIPDNAGASGSGSGSGSGSTPALASAPAPALASVSASASGITGSADASSPVAGSVDTHANAADGAGVTSTIAAPAEGPSIISTSNPTIAHGQPVALDGIILFAPADGQLIAQKAIDDETFREGFLGSCFGIAPSAGVVYAPCDGTMALLTDTRHAFVIETPQGNKVMVHIGLGTVAMEGAGFQPLVSAGDSVTVGQPLMNIDLALIHTSGYQDTVITALLKDA